MAGKPEKLEKREGKSSHAALRVAIGGVFSLLAGLTAQVITAYLFGAGSDMDAFFTAMTIPTYLQFSLLGGLPFVVIPAFIHEETAGREDGAWALAGTFIKIAGGVLFVVTLIGALGASQIIDIMAPGFGESKSHLASQMLSILMFTIPFLGLGSFTCGIENVRGRFFWPASATAIGSVGNFLTLLFLKPLVGPVALAWGALVSAILYGCVTTIPVLRHGWKKTLRLKDPRVVEMIKLIAPFIFFGLITQVKSLLERYLASSLPDGDLSYIGYANKISNIFVILLATSVAATIFPEMARGFSKHGEKGLLKEADFGLRITFALALPAVAITTVVAVPLIQLLYERGAFVAKTTMKVSHLIPIVMLADVLFRMIINMIGRTFFVLKDTLTSNLVISLTIIVYAAAAFLATKQWGYVGLALAQPVQSGLAVLMLGILLFRRVKQFSVRSLTKSFFIYAGVSVVAALAAWTMIQLFSNTGVVLQLIISISISVSIYLVMLYAFDQKITSSLLEMSGLKKIFTVIQPRLEPIKGVWQTISGRHHNPLFSDYEERNPLVRTFQAVRIRGSATQTALVAKQAAKSPSVLLMLAFAVGLLSPLLISEGMAPDVVRWIADICIALMSGLVIFRMLSFNHIPRPFWVIVFLSIVGVLAAIFTGQGIAPTIWGWWLMFQYPLVGLFCYLQPRWPKAFPRPLLVGLVSIAGFELLVQVGQFLMGVVPGDHLAGTFGDNGTGNLVLFLILVLCFSLGHWLHTRRWFMMVIALVIGILSSVLGEMKLFYLVIVLLGGVSLSIFLIFGKQRWRVVPILFLLIIMIAVFIPLYNMIIPSSGDIPLEAYFSDSELLTKYLTFVNRSVSGENYYYDIGRNFAVVYGWEKITSNILYLPFGYGLGARTESKSLGIIGRGLEEGDLGISSGTGMLVMIQEMGIIGMLALAGFIVAVIVRMFKQIRQYPDSHANSLRYGIILFSVFWPLWLWYNMAWNLRVPMLLYWSILGYVSGENRQRLMEPEAEPVKPESGLVFEQQLLTGDLG